MVELLCFFRVCHGRKDEREIKKKENGSFALTYVLRIPLKRRE